MEHREVVKNYTTALVLVLAVCLLCAGYCDTAMAENMNQKALDKILSEVPIGRVIKPSEVSSLVAELYRNEALSGEVFYIHGGLRLGSRG